MKRFPMTPEGKRLLEEEVKYLKEVKRHEIIKDIKEARAHGDLSENSEYDDAKERQSLCEGRIKDIDAKLSLARVIDVKENAPSEGEDRKVIFGCTVVLEDEDENELVYKIVGVDESDVKSGKISNVSPIAKALMGKEEGDEVSFRAPRGMRTLEIIEVKYI